MLFFEKSHHPFLYELIKIHDNNNKYVKEMHLCEKLLEERKYIYDNWLKLFMEDVNLIIFVVELVLDNRNDTEFIKKFRTEFMEKDINLTNVWLADDVRKDQRMLFIETLFLDS